MHANSTNEKWVSSLVLLTHSMTLVGTAGFELATPCTPCKCATRLRYAPFAGL